MTHNLACCIDWGPDNSFLHCRPSKFRKMFAWALLYVTGTLTLPNATMVYLSYPEEAYNSGEKVVRLLLHEQKTLLHHAINLSVLLLLVVERMQRLS